MITIKPKGDWRGLQKLVRNYDKRVAFAKRNLMMEVAKAFLKELKSKAPQDEEYKPYIKSLKVVELSQTGGVERFGVISREQKVKVGDILAGPQRQRTVVYVTPVTTGEGSQLGSLMQTANPWPVEMLPHGIKKSSVVLVHRIVTEGEFVHSKERVSAHISFNRESYRRLGVHWGEVSDEKESVEGMKSIPDWMSLAIRAEFGINTRLQSHWRPTMRKMKRVAVEIFKKNKNIQGALFDPNFRDHMTQRETNLPTMTEGEFRHKTEVFQTKVV
jgi:hypothetical protein